MGLPLLSFVLVRFFFVSFSLRFRFFAGGRATHYVGFGGIDSLRNTTREGGNSGEQS